MNWQQARLWTNGERVVQIYIGPYHMDKVVSALLERDQICPEYSETEIIPGLFYDQARFSVVQRMIITRASILHLSSEFLFGRFYDMPLDIQGQFEFWTLFVKIISELHNAGNRHDTTCLRLERDGFSRKLLVLFSNVACPLIDPSGRFTPVYKKMYEAQAARSPLHLPISKVLRLDQNSMAYHSWRKITEMHQRLPRIYGERDLPFAMYSVRLPYAKASPQDFFFTSGIVSGRVDYLHRLNATRIIDLRYKSKVLLRCLVENPLFSDGDTYLESLIYFSLITALHQFQALQTETYTPEVPM